MKRNAGWILAGCVSVTALAATMTQYRGASTSGTAVLSAGSRYLAGMMPSGTSDSAAVGATLAANGVTLSFPVENGGRYSVRMTGSGMATAVAKDPVRVFVCDTTECPDDGSGSPITDKAPLGTTNLLYTSAEPNSSGVVAKATILTAQNTRFEVEDLYTVAGSASPGAFKMVRTITTTLPSGGQVTDHGFSSQFRMAFESQAVKPYHFFSPAVWYDQNSYVPATWFGGSGTRGKSSIYWRETRAGLPLVMMQDPGTGTSLTVAHIGDAPSSNIVETPNDNGRWLVSDDIRYGSLGVQKTDTSSTAIGFIYPANETMQDTSDTVKWIHRSNLISNRQQQYTMLLSLGVEGASLTNGDVATRDINAAMADSWRMVYNLMRPASYRTVEPEAVFNAGIGLIFDYAKVGAHSAGFVGQTNLPNGPSNSQVQSTNWQYVMGYIGQQIPLAFQLYWRSFDTENEHAHTVKDIRYRAEAILDFWANRSAPLNGGADGKPVLPLTWYNESSDTFSNRAGCDMPIFLRYLGDGMEAMVSAAILARNKDKAHLAWEKSAVNFGHWLVANQRTDDNKVTGYWYRAYTPDGQPYDPGKACTSRRAVNANGGDVRQNTTHVIRFLTQLAMATDNKDDHDAFLGAATRAGKFAIQQTFGLGKYTGGTTDTPNVSDREGAIIALRAALALYDATGDSDWLKWARQAANVAESYTYAYSFKLNTAAGKSVPLQQQWGSLGMSMIATGQSAADNSASLLSYDLFRLYLFDPTNDAHFLDAAELMESTTKYTTHLPYASQNYSFNHEGLAPEATALFLMQPTQQDDRDKDGNVLPAWQWLPWVTNAELDPLQRMQDRFGNKSISKTLGQGMKLLQDSNKPQQAKPFVNWGK